MKQRTSQDHHDSVRSSNVPKQRVPDNRSATQAPRSQDRQTERNRLFGQQPNDQARREPQAHRVAMPSFGSDGQQNQASESGTAGWGMGDAGIKPLQYQNPSQEDSTENFAARRQQTRSRRFNESGSVDPPPSPRAFSENSSFEPPNQRQQDASASIDDILDIERKWGASPPPPPPPRSRDRRRGDRSFVPSVNQDPFWSDSPNDQPLRDRNSFPPERRRPARPFSESNSEDEIQEGSKYRATPFDPSELQRSQSSYDDRQADSWQHLPRRRSDPPPPASSQPRQQQFRRQSNYFDDSDHVDRQFREHQRQRDAQSRQRFPPVSQAPQGYSNPNIQTATAAASEEFIMGPARSGLKCARCLQPGHTARECTGPVKCKLCGEVGHFAEHCSARQMQQGDRRTASPFGQAPREEQRRPPIRQGWGDAPRTDNDVGPFGVHPRQRTREPFEAERPAAAPRQSPFDDMPARKLFEGSPFDDTPPRKPFEEPAPTVRASQEPQDATDEAEAEASERLAKRSRRGFVDAAEAVEEVPERKQKKGGRRVIEREDDEQADEGEYLREQRAARKSARKAAQKAGKAAFQRDNSTPVNLPEFVSISQLAQTLGVRYEAFTERLEELGYGEDVFPGKILNREISGMIAMEYNFEPIFEGSAASEGEDRDLTARPEVEDKTFLPTRPPVVTIMGHVDHGKTTILDYLRKSSVAAGEAGGITQHIGAFSVPLSATGRTITFLDTPGHAAFLAMRQRGANVTDIVILVVAADDSVKPQTLESIRCAREAGVPMIVAINKVDKEEADVQRVKQDLARNGVEIEDFGGDTQVVCVSGKTGQGMEELEEAAVTLSEILDHRAETDGNVEGWVLEATTKRNGRVATVLVKRGTLRSGAVIVAGKTWARVRTLRNEAGVTVQEIGPGMPVEVDGWKDQPVAGDEVLQASGEQEASTVVEYRVEVEERGKTAQDMEAINEARRLEQEKRAREKAAERATGTETTPQPAPTPKQETTTGQIQVPFLIKADVSGSAEAVSAYIPSLTSPLITPQILLSGVGPIHQSDIELASAAQGHIVAFNLPPNNDMKGLAESKGIKVLENNVIYRVLDQVKEVLELRLPPVVSQRVLGEAEISAAFEISLGGRKTMKIAGCKVRNGGVSRGSRVRVTRAGEKVYDGKLLLDPTAPLRI